MRLTLALYMVGAVSISGFPLFNGFISKSMIISASGEGHLSVVYLLLTLASVGTFLHTGLKLPYFTWYGPDRRIVPSAPPKNMTAAMALAAAGCILLGTAPHLLYGRLPYPVDYHPYTTAHVVETLQLLLFTGIAFFFFIPRLGGEATISLDTDWFYRRPGRFARRVLVDGVRDLFEEVERLAVGAASSLARRSVNPVAFFARAWGRTVPGDMPYDPHIQRPPIQIAISLTLLFAVILSLWATLR
jgi:multicomponent Na+:H+ antiporter subunit D